MIWAFPFALAFAASLAVAIILVATKRIHGHLTLDSHAGVQKLHSTPTPRIGGVAVLSGMVIGTMALPA